MDFSEWKPLQFNDMSEMTKLTDVSSLKQSDPKVLISKLDLLFKQAESSEKDLDMAKAFILYMRYMGAIEILFRKPEYRKDPKYYQALLDSRHTAKAIERAEFFKNALLHRLGQGPAPSSDTSKPSPEPKNLGSTNSLTENDSPKSNSKTTDSSTPLALSAEVEGISATDLFGFISCFLHGTGNASRFTALPAVIFALAKSHGIGSADVSFSGKTLVLSNVQTKLRVLCLDLRRAFELDASTLTLAVNSGALRVTSGSSSGGRSKTYTSTLCSFLYLPIASELISSGLTGKQLHAKLESAEDRLAWEQRSDVDLVVLMDQQTQEYDYRSKAPLPGPLHTVSDALLRWDNIQQVACRPSRRVVFVRGGYQRLVLELPPLVGNYSPALKKYYSVSEAGAGAATLEDRLDALRYPQMDGATAKAQAQVQVPPSNHTGPTSSTQVLQPSEGVAGVSLFPAGSHLDRADLLSLNDSIESFYDKYKYNSSAPAAAANSNRAAGPKPNENANAQSVNSMPSTSNSNQSTKATPLDQSISMSSLSSRLPPTINRALKPTQTPSAKAEMSRQQERLLIDYMENMKSRIEQLEAHNQSLMRERAAPAAGASAFLPNASPSAIAKGSLGDGESKQPPPKTLKRSNSQPDLNPSSSLDLSTGRDDKFTLISGTNAPRVVPLFDRSNKPVAVDFSSNGIGVLGPGSASSTPSSSASANGTQNGDQHQKQVSETERVQPSASDTNTTGGTSNSNPTPPNAPKKPPGPETSNQLLNADLKPTDGRANDTGSGSDKLDSKRRNPSDSSTLPSKSSGSLPLPKSPAQPLTPNSSSTKLVSASAVSNEEMNQFYQKLLQTLGACEPVILRSLQPAAGRVNLGATGLVNLGNTCFMNSVVQLLSNTPGMRDYFLHDNKMYLKRLAQVGAVKAALARVPGGSRSSKQGATQFELCIQFGTLLTALWKGAYKHISPVEFKAAIAKSAPDLFPYGTRYTAQQDAQEFLLFLLDNLHEELNCSIVPPGTKRFAASGAVRSGDELIEQGALLWNEHLKYNNSAITAFFNGQLLAITRCSRCDSSFFKFDAFMYLSVPIPGNGRSVTIYDCLNEYFKNEYLKDDSAYNCEHCHQRTSALLSPRFHRLPRYLTVILKRFQSTGRTLKVTTQVDFPLEGLQLQRYFSRPEIARTIAKNGYRLVGAVNHYGSLESGHYTAFCRSPLLQMRDERPVWFKFDDERVTEMRPADVVSPAAYILLYEIASS